MSILSLKFPNLGIDFWKGVIMTITDSPIFPDWDQPPEEEPLAHVSVDRTENADDADVPGDAWVVPSQNIAESQQKSPQSETILR